MSATPTTKKGLLQRITERAKKFVFRPRVARRQDAYPKTGTGARQGARLERQRRNWMLDFSASERCVAAIAARRAA